MPILPKKLISPPKNSITLKFIKTLDQHETRKNNMKIIYLARWDKKKSAGAIQKVENTVSALRKNGYDASKCLIEESGFRGHLIFALTILKIRCDLLIIRATSFTMILCIPGMALQRILGSKIVLDLPNPISSILMAISTNIQSRIKRIILKSLIHLNFPISTLFAHRIIQYGNEDLFTMLPVSKKTVLTGNGIDVANFKKSTPKLNNIKNTITLIGVAKLDDWHGFDRVINGIANYNQQTHPPFKVRFVIVGDGDAYSKLRNQVNKLDLNDYIVFTGPLHNENLNIAFESADIAIGPLGAHRIGLSILSSLKIREYLARGIPSVLSSQDVDIPDGMSFIHRLDESDAPASIDKILQWYVEIRRNENLTEDIQKFAESHLDYKNKIHIYTDILRK